MAPVRCLQEVFQCLKQGDIEKSKQLFSKLSCELHSNEFKFFDLRSLISRGLCRCFAAEWCVPKTLKGDLVPLRYVKKKNYLLLLNIVLLCFLLLPFFNSCVYYLRKKVCYQSKQIVIDFVVFSCGFFLSLDYIFFFNEYKHV